MRRGFPRIGAALMAAVALGCEGTTLIPLDPPDLVLADSSVWAGAEIRLAADEPLEAGLWTVTLAGSAVTFRVAAESLLVTAPSRTEGGQLLVFYDDSIVIDRQIYIADFHDAYQGPSVRGYVLPLAGGGWPQVFATGDTGLVLLNLATGAVQSFPTSMHATSCAAAPGPTFRPNALALHGLHPNPGAPGGRSCAWASWDMSTRTQLDSAGTAFGYIAAQVGADSWFWAEGNLDGVYLTAGFLTNSDAVTSVRLSGAGDLAVFTNNSACCIIGPDRGWPVLNLPSGSVRYLVPSTNITRVHSATFSPDGDTLFTVVTDSGSDPGQLVARRADSGTELARLLVNVDADRFADVLADPTEPWLYIFREPTLAVVDRRTMRVVATLPGDAPPDAFHGPARLVLSPTENMLYAVSASHARDAAAPLAIYRFRLP